MLLTVQLPNNLVITGTGRIEIRDAAEKVEARFDSVYVIAPPSNIRAGPDLKSQDRELMPPDLIRDFDYIPRECSASQCAGCRGLIRQTETRRKAGIEAR